MKLFKKTALAMSVAAMSATTAMAGDLDFNGGDRTVVLADVIFGVVDGRGSEETLITAPSVVFDLETAGDEAVAGSTATIKYTLGGGAVFGEDLSTTDLVDESNGGAGAFSANAAAGPNTSADADVDNVTYEVVQGGAIGDNTITFRLTFNDDATAAGADADGSVLLQNLVFEGYAVKNLTTALNPLSTEKQVKLGVEYVEAADSAPNSDDVNATSTDDPLTVFASQAPVDLVADIEEVLESGIRINVGNAERTFTNNGVNDFDPAGDTTVVFLGTLQLELQDIVGFGYNGPAVLPANRVKIAKENGDEFDFQGGDVHKLEFFVGSGSLQDGSTFSLRAPTGGDCTGTVFSANAIDDTELTAFELNVSGTTTELTDKYEVCYSVTGAAGDLIPEVADISAEWTIDFFNARYDNVELEAGDFGELQRNGCIASFFNVPAVGNADTAYIRLTNTSSSNVGDIRGTLYAQDGTVLGQDVTVAPALATSATQVFSTEGANRTTAADQDIIDIETAFDVDGATEYKGRARLVLKGAFDTCEGQGLIRTGGGSLFNMTSTTQGNEAGGANDGNNGN